jgi:hypothetical protein
MALPSFTPGTTIKASEMNQALATLFDMAHPVGSYYETSDTSFDPNSAWPGTWVEDTAGRVLVAQNTGTFLTVGATGGEETHTLTTAEMPSHNHTATTYIGWQSGGGPGCGKLTTNDGNPGGWQTVIGNTGGDGAHNNLQPYIVVKRWHRTA